MKKWFYSERIAKVQNSRYLIRHNKRIDYVLCSACKAIGTKVWPCSTIGNKYNLTMLCSSKKHALIVGSGWKFGEKLYIRIGEFLSDFIGNIIRVIPFTKTHFPCYFF